MFFDFKIFIDLHEKCVWIVKVLDLSKYWKSKMSGLKECSVKRSCNILFEELERVLKLITVFSGDFEVWFEFEYFAEVVSPCSFSVEEFGQLKKFEKRSKSSFITSVIINSNSHF